MWLNSHGEAGRDNILQLRWLSQLMFRPSHDRKRYPFFLLAVQSPPENPDWTMADSSATADDMINVVTAILEQTVRDNPVDRDRIYLAGISSGGAGCWELAIRRPEIFAAVAPISSAGADNTKVSRCRNMPIWVFNCSKDSSTPIDGVRQTVDALSAAGGTVHLTEVDSSLHDAWTVAFDDYHLLDWLLSQRRGQASLAPGTVPLATRLQDFAQGWQWWQVLLQIGIPAAFFLVVWNALHRRRQMRHAVRP